MKNNFCIVFNRRTGRPAITLEGISSALLTLYAMNNTPSYCDTVIFTFDGIILEYFEGKEKDFPSMCKDMRGLSVDILGIDITLFH